MDLNLAYQYEIKKMNFEKDIYAYLNNEYWQDLWTLLMPCLLLCVK